MDSRIAELIEIAEADDWSPLELTGQQIRRAADRRRHTRGVVVGTLTAALIVGAGWGTFELIRQPSTPSPAASAPSPAASTSPLPTKTKATSAVANPDDLEVMRVQGPYMDLADQINAIDKAQSETRLGGVVLDVAGKAVNVYWVGPAPKALTQLRNQAARKGITIAIHPARSTQAALFNASTKLGDLNEKQQLGIATISLANDGSGLTVRAPGLADADSGKSTPNSQQSALLDAIRKIVEETGVQIRTANYTGVKGTPLYGPKTSPSK